MTTKTIFDIKELNNFTGTENYFKHYLGLLYTDGIKCLAEKAGAYWLIDAVTSYLPEVKKIDNDFMVWELAVNLGNNQALLTAKTDTDEPFCIFQEIEYTDFPADYIKLYQCNGVLLLPSEY